EDSCTMPTDRAERIIVSPQLATAKATRTGLDVVAIRQLLEAVSAIGQAHGNEDAVLDALVSGVRAFVGEAAVRLVLPRAGPHPGQPLRFSIRGRAPTAELTALVAAWEEELRA